MIPALLEIFSTALRRRIFENVIKKNKIHQIHYNLHNSR